jgi:hypothetical protein
MHNGTIEWNGADLGRIGKPRLIIRRQTDPAPPGAPTRMLVTLGVTVALEALDPGTILARAEWLAAAMRHGEGILRVSHGTGHTTEWLALPGENNLEEALTGNTNSFELTFTAVENLGSAALQGHAGAQFTPAGTSVPVQLHCVRELREEVRTARPSERNSARGSTTASVSDENATDVAAPASASLQRPTGSAHQHRPLALQAAAEAAAAEERGPAGERVQPAGGERPQHAAAVPGPGVWQADDRRQTAGRGSAAHSPRHLEP